MDWPSGLTSREIQVPSDVVNRAHRLPRQLPVGDIVEQTPRVGARIADVAIALTDPASFVAAMPETGNLDLRYGDGDQVLALAAKHFTVRDVLAQLALDLTAHNAVEPTLVFFDPADHGEHLPGRRRGSFERKRVTSPSHRRARRCWQHS